VFTLSVGIWMHACAAQTDNNPFGPASPQMQQFQRSEQNSRRNPNPFELLGETPPPQQRMAQPQMPQLQAPEPIPANPPEAPPAFWGCKCLGENEDSFARIHRALVAPLHDQGLDYDGTALEEVVNELSQEYGIPIQLDIRALGDAGAGPGDAVRVRMRGVTLQSAPG
jgi:hypothetical protein